MSNDYSIEDRLDAYAESWRPEPGDKLWGTVVDIDTREGDYGDYPVITVQKQDGEELAFHAFHTVARNELAKHRPAVGDEIGIKFIGKMTSKAGREFTNYKIIVRKHHQEEIDWQGVGEAAQAELGGVTDDPEAGQEPLAGVAAEEAPKRGRKKAEITGQTDDIPF